MHNIQLMPVILSGGSGSRLWPLSRRLLPKQFLHLSSSGYSLLQDTLLRLKDLNIAAPIVVCNEEHRFMVAEHLREIDMDQAKIILEPEGKNTAPAVALAAHAAVNPKAVLAVFPADHQINHQDSFQQSLLKAVQLAQQNFLVTFGIKPSRPETGYGYIQIGDALENNQDGFLVRRFVEKPNTVMAEEFLKEDSYYWNSGMFVFTAATYLNELKKFAPEIYAATLSAVTGQIRDLDFIRIDKTAFRASPANSIDYAVMEKTDRAVVVPVECDWTDLGNWSSMWEITQKDEKGNALIGDVLSIETQNSIVHSDHRLTAVVGLQDCVVVDTRDALLVAHKNQTQRIKDIVEKLTLEQRSESELHHRVYRPWGYYENLVEVLGYKVKRIMVRPKASLSLQLHHRRSEHWVVVQGCAEIINGEKQLKLSQNQSTYIPINTKHRLTNPGTEELYLIEVQCGDYLGEDDIVRYEDSYGRVS